MHRLHPHLVKRGLPTPTLVTTDGAPALIAAVEALWPHTLRQRCLVHKVRNVLDKVPQGVKLVRNGDKSHKNAGIKSPPNMA